MPAGVRGTVLFALALGFVSVEGAFRPRDDPPKPPPPPTGSTGESPPPPNPPPPPDAKAGNPALPPYTPYPEMPPAAPPSPSTPPLAPPNPSTPPMEPVSPSRPPVAPNPAPAECSCDVYKQGARESDDFTCSKTERGENVCVPAIWAGKKKPRKYSPSEAMKYYKCGASDWKLCTKSMWSPSPPAMPSPVYSPMPPSRPTRRWEPSPPPMRPNARVVACVDKKSKAGWCIKKWQKNKCHTKKVQKKCQLTCGAVCVAG